MPQSVILADEFALPEEAAKPTDTPDLAQEFDLPSEKTPVGTLIPGRTRPDFIPQQTDYAAREAAARARGVAKTSLDQPMIELPQLPEIKGTPEEPLTGMEKVGSAAAGVYNEGAKLVSSFTSPANVAIMLSTGGLASAAKAGSVAARRALVGIGTYFAGSMGKEAINQIPEAKKTFDNPDASPQEKAAAITAPVLTAGMSVLAALGAVHEVRPDLANVLRGKSPKEAVNRLNEEAATTTAPEQKAVLQEAATKIEEAGQPETNLSTTERPVLAEEFTPPPLGPEAAKLSERPGGAEKLAEIQDALKSPDTVIQYSVWDKDMISPGMDRVAQVDLINPKDTKSVGGIASTNRTLLTELGVDAPPAPESLPPGRYTLDEIKAAIAKEGAKPDVASEFLPPEGLAPETPVVGLGAASPAEFQPVENFVTSIKNSVVDQEMKARGETPLMQEAAKDFGSTWNEAMKRIDENQNVADELISELGQKIRPATNVENAILLHRKIELENIFNKADRNLKENTGTPDSLAADRVAKQQALDDLLEINKISRATGSEQSAALNTRKLMAAQDFSLTSMLAKRSTAKGDVRLTPEEIAEVEAQHKAIQEAETALAKHQQQGPERALEEFVSKAEKSPASDVVNPRAERAEILSALKEALKESPDLDDSNFIRRLAENFVREGVKDREALVDAVHNEIKDIIPGGITRRQTMDAISGYGEYRKLDPDAVKATLRDLKGQMQQIGKLQDMEAGRAPSKTGGERRTPSDEERRLIKQVQEAKRKGGFDVTDPAKQLKSALAAIKTRLQNSIRDLEQQISTKTQIVAGKTKVILDAEATALKAMRDKLKDEYDAIFQKPELTDEQRLALAEKAADRQIAELERQLRTDEVFARGKAEQLQSPALEAKRAQIDALKEEREYARQRLQPKPDPKTDVEAKVASLDKQIEEIERQIRTEEVFSDAKKTEPDSPEITSRKEALSALKERRENLREQIQPTDFDELALQTFKVRTANRIADLQRRVANGDFSKKAQRGVKLDEEAALLQAQVDSEKAKFDQALEADRYARLSEIGKLREQSLGAYDAARNLMTTGEFSFILRQGKLAAASHPIMTARALPKTFQALFADEVTARALDIQTKNDPVATRAIENGVHFAEEGAKLSAREETLASKLADKIPLLRNFNQAGRVFLNKLRVDLYKSMEGGRELTPEQGEALAKYVNEATGRGSLGGLEKSSVELGRLLFAPRYLASRLQYAVGHSLWGGDLTTRRIIATEYARTLVGLGVYYASLNAAFNALTDDPQKKPVVTMDPRSTDFGKVKIGNTRIDPLAGLSQVIVFGARTALGEKTTAKGDVIPLRGKVPYGGQKWTDVAATFARSKLHPLPGAVVNLFNGTDLAGKEATITNQAENLVAPLTYIDVYQALEEQDLPVGVSASLLAMLGEGLQTYDAQTKPAKQMGVAPSSAPAKKLLTLPSGKKVNVAPAPPK